MLVDSMLPCFLMNVAVVLRKVYKRGAKQNIYEKWPFVLIGFFPSPRLPNCCVTSCTVVRPTQLCSSPYCERSEGFFSLRLPHLNFAKEAMEFTCSEYWDMAMALSASGSQTPCMLHASSVPRVSEDFLEALQKQCCYCGNAFSQICNVHCHESIHCLLKPTYNVFHCDNRDAIYANKHALSAHNTICTTQFNCHTLRDECSHCLFNSAYQSFHCDKGDTVFTRSDKLYRHKKNCTGIVCRSSGSECKYCSKTIAIRFSARQPEGRYCPFAISYKTYTCVNCNVIYASREALTAAYDSIKRHLCSWWSTLQLRWRRMATAVLSNKQVWSLTQPTKLGRVYGGGIWRRGGGRGLGEGLSNHRTAKGRVADSVSEEKRIYNLAEGMQLISNVITTLLREGEGWGCRQVQQMELSVVLREEEEE
ncbi:hypothetical protein PR048_009311 [Dryococelus australis]|uniref:C2H2-type domain-containing protein n=1 Tax=Dryococelus australis TaxID=614101 RepID=A0ABQ9HZX0_9NEOP|nr:hypothetical protein PR048_009311 [Dryococelus australis]